MYKKKVYLILLAIVLISPFLMKESYAWFNTNFPYRNNITINLSLLAGNNSYYPPFFNMSRMDSTFWGNLTSTNGSDIIIVDADDTTKLCREIVSINTTAKTGEMYFAKPLLDNQTETTRHYLIYWGYSGSTETNNQACVWQNYTFVQHGDDYNASALLDSSGNNRTGNKQGSNNPLQVTGKIFNAQKYDGTTSFVNFGNVNEFGNGATITIESIVNASSAQNDAEILNKKFNFDFGKYQSKLSFGFFPSADEVYQANTQSFNNGTFDYFAFTYTYNSGTTAQLYFNPAPIAGSWVLGNGNANPPSNTNNFMLSPNTGYLGSFWGAGGIDEVRVSNVTRNANWINTTYQNLFNEKNFNEIGTTETLGGANIQINSPLNTTYYGNTSITVNFTVQNSSSSTFPVNVSLDGSFIYANQTFNNGATVSFSQAITTGGSHNLTVLVNDTTTATKSVYFYIFYGLNISVFASNGTALTNWNLKADNGSSQYFNNSNNNPTLFEWLTLPQGAMNITINQTNLFDNETRNFTINSSMGLIQRDFTLYRIQQFQANSSTGTQLDFNITFNNGTGQLNYTSTNKIVQVSLRTIGTGTNTINVSSQSFGTVADSITFDNNSTINKTYILSASGFTINVFDEQNVSQRIIFSVSGTNGSCSWSASNQTTFSQNISQLCLGQNTIVISNSSYEARTYYVTLTADQNLSLTAYLLNLLNGIDQSIIVITFQDIPIPNALVDIRRNINGTFQTVSQRITDSAGSTTFFLDPTTTYQVLVTADNYVAKIFNLNPSSGSPTTYVRLTFLGTQGAQLLNLTTTFTNISYSLIDTPHVYYHNGAFNITYMVSSSNNDLQLIGIDIFFWNFTTDEENATKVFSYNTTSNPSGVTIIYNTSSDIGYYKAVAFFQKSGFDRYDLTNQTFVIVQNSGLPSFDVTNTGLSIGTWRIIGLFVLVASIGFMLKFGAFAGLGTGIAVMAILTFGMNIYPVAWFVLTFLISIGLILLKGGL